MILYSLYLTMTLNKKRNFTLTIEEPNSRPVTIKVSERDFWNTVSAFGLELQPLDEKSPKTRFYSRPKQ